MGIRTKLILVFVVLGFVPMVIASVLLYRGGKRSVETRLRNDVVQEANGIAREIDASLNENEASLVELARSPALQKYVQAENKAKDRSNELWKQRNRHAALEEISRDSVPTDVYEAIRGFLISNATHYSAIYCLNTSGSALFRADSVMFGNDGGNITNVVEVRTEYFTASAPDPRVWIISDLKPLRSPLSKEANGATLRYSIPVFVGDAGAKEPRGVLIAELNGGSLLNDATLGRMDEGRDSASVLASDSSQHEIIILDHEGRILYHTNAALRYQMIDAVLPTFKDISKPMNAGESGSNSYETANARWLVGYKNVPSLDVSVAVAGNYSAAIQGLNRLGWIAVILFSLFGLLTVIVFTRILRNTARSIERVTEGAVAIAGGRLEQRIEVRSNDETRLLAESFNIMTDRLREQIARETESRQFEAFMRLSAMLTHDLKNAIVGLSLLVGNMERQFHREEFRADAMKSLTEAVDKLRRLVTKLSEPVQSLSSEHQLAAPTDLVPIVRKALNATAEPARASHQIEVQLPETLIATVEADRIEKVFENLIINALEAMGEKSGKLTIEAGPTPQGEVFFRVSDTGPGMSDTFQSVKLFRPFATTKKSGIGLGLYTCREIVLAHGGHIDVESKRGFGATFRVVLPSKPQITKSAKA